MKMMEGHQ